MQTDLHCENMLTSAEGVTDLRGAQPRCACAASREPWRCLSTPALPAHHIQLLQPRRRRRSRRRQRRTRRRRRRGRRGGGGGEGEEEEEEYKLWPAKKSARSWQSLWFRSCMCPCLLCIDCAGQGAVAIICSTNARCSVGVQEAVSRSFTNLLGAVNKPQDFMAQHFCSC